MVKTHAMYDLPTQLKSHGAPVFGTSTRDLPYRLPQWRVA